MNEIQPNKASALIALGTAQMVDGEIYKVRYINSFGNLDCLIALGTGDGVGPNFYTLLSDRGMFLVTSIVSSLPDISKAVFGEVYLLVTSEGIFRCHISNQTDSGISWEEEEVLGDHLVSCTEDSGMYLVSNGTIKPINSESSTQPSPQPPSLSPSPQPSPQPPLQPSLQIKLVTTEETYSIPLTFWPTKETNSSNNSYNNSYSYSYSYYGSGEGIIMIGIWD